MQEMVFLSHLPAELNGGFPRRFAPSIARAEEGISAPVGQLCTPKDVLAADVEVVSVRAGDLAVFPYAGAYAWHIPHHDFLRHPHPRRIYLPVEETAVV